MNSDSVHDSLSPDPVFISELIGGEVSPPKLQIKRQMIKFTLITNL